MSLLSDYYTLTRRAFGYLAPVYNIMTIPLLPVRRKVVNFVDPNPGAVVLDVATGTGQQAFAFAKRSCQVTGVDLTESMLRIARTHNRAGRVHFEAGDATCLRFGADSFDIVSVSFALHDTPQSVLEEMVRVVKAGGIVVVVDYGLPRNKVARWLAHRFVSLYEGPYYDEFLTSDWQSCLEKRGIEITGEISVLGGVGKIWKGVKATTIV